MQIIPLDGGRLRYATPQPGKHTYEILDHRDHVVARGDVSGLTDRVTEALTAIGRAVLGTPPPAPALRFDLGAFATWLISLNGIDAALMARLVPGLSDAERIRIRDGLSRIVDDGHGRLRVESVRRPDVHVEHGDAELGPAGRPAADRCAGLYDDGIAGGNLTRCSPSAGCGFAGCPSPTDCAARGNQ